jgi:hypothetical protein
VTFWAEHGYGPTIREVQRLAGLSSTSVTNMVVRTLVEGGLLMAELELPRTVRPVSYGRHWKGGRLVG